jgi:hypothetical protein
MARYGQHGCAATNLLGVAVWHFAIVALHDVESRAGDAPVCPGAGLRALLACRSFN